MAMPSWTNRRRTSPGATDPNGKAVMEEPDAPDLAEEERARKPLKAAKKVRRAAKRARKAAKAAME